MNQGAKTLMMINSIYSSLSKAERKVADVVLSDKEFVVYSSITDMAEKAGTGETTVLRFCRKLKFRGYQEFKLTIARDLVSPSEHVHGTIGDGDDMVTIARKITSQNIRALDDALLLLQEEELRKAAEALIRSKKIHFFGVGSSGITAHDAKYRFMRLGFHVDSASDAHIIAMNSALTGPEDVVVGISASGSAKDLVDAVGLAKRNGAFVICLTQHAKSPITQFADAILLAAAKEKPLQGGAFSSKLAQLHVLDILSTIVAMNRKHHTFSAIEQTAKSVIAKLY